MVMRVNPRWFPYKCDDLVSVSRFKEHFIRYVCALQFLKSNDDLILDIGCGIGYGSAYLAHKGVGKVIAGDIFRESIEDGRKHYKMDRLEFLSLEATRLPFKDSSFDVTTALELIEHLTNAEGMLKEAKRVLRKNGFLICSTPNKEISSPGTDKTSIPDHVKEFYPKEFQGMLREYFGDVKLYGIGEEASKRLNLTKLATRIKNVYLRSNRMRRLIKFIARFGTKFVFKEFRAINLEKVKVEDFDKFCGGKARLIPFSKSPFPYGSMIAIAKKTRN